jgi:oligoribonuclease
VNLGCWQIACIITDGNLEPVDEGVSFVIQTDKAVLDAMGEWCTDQHGKVTLSLRYAPNALLTWFI